MAMFIAQSVFVGEYDFVAQSNNNIFVLTQCSVLRLSVLTKGGKLKWLEQTKWWRLNPAQTKLQNQPYCPPHPNHSTFTNYSSECGKLIA